MSLRRALRTIWCAVRGGESCARFDPEEPSTQGEFARWILDQKHASQRRQQAERLSDRVRVPRPEERRHGY